MANPESLPKSILDDFRVFDESVSLGAKDKMTALAVWGHIYGLKTGDLLFDDGGDISVTEQGLKRRHLCPYKDGEFPGIYAIEQWYKAMIQGVSYGD